MRPIKPAAGANIEVVAVDRYRAVLQHRTRRVKQAFLIFVILPTIGAGVYFGLIASNRYVSMTQLVVVGDSLDATSSNPLMSLVSPGEISATGTAMLYSYLQSPEIVENLDKAIGLRQRFATKTADFFSRMASDAEQEDFVDYYLDRVHVTVEPNSPVLTVTAEAFTPQDAAAISQGLLAISEKSLNRLLAKRQDDTIAFAKSEVAEAGQRLLDVQNRITDYRTQHSEIDPVHAAESVGAIAADLTKALALERAKLETLLSYLKPDNPQVLAEKAKVKSIQSQLDNTRGTLAGKSDTTYAALVSEYETLNEEEKLAQDEYAKTLEFLTVARGDAQRQHAYVMGLVNPTLPEKSTEPERIRSVMTVFVVCLLLFGIGLLATTAVREHAGAA